MTSVTKNISPQTRNWAPQLMAGATAGLIASIPMAGIMIGLNRVLPGRKRSWFERWKATPPKQITARMARRTGVGKVVRPGRSWDAPTWLAHLGYGAVTASLYPLVTRLLPLPQIARGMLFAMGIWGMSYMGWLPSANVLPSATHHTARRNGIMITSHLIWGALIGLLVGRMTDQREADDAFRQD